MLGKPWQTTTMLSTCRALIALSCLTFCSCQSLSTSPSQRWEQRLQSATPRPPQLFREPTTEAKPLQDRPAAEPAHLPKVVIPEFQKQLTPSLPASAAPLPSQVPVTPSKPVPITAAPVAPPSAPVPSRAPLPEVAPEVQPEPLPPPQVTKHPLWSPERSVPNRTRLPQEYNPPAKFVEVPRLSRNPNISLAANYEMASKPHHGARAYGGHPANCRSCPPGDCPPFRFETDAPQGQFVPPGLARPWPYDEYIWNGCDRNDDVRVKRDWTVIGLDPQDTIAHYDTFDGNTEVARANCVPIYAPRFAAARKVTEVITYHNQDNAIAAMQPERLAEQLEKKLVTTAVQPIQPVDDGSFRGPETVRDRNQGIAVEDRFLPYLAQKDFMPHEDLLIIQRGIFHGDEKLRLAQRAEAAIIWSQDKSVQVVLDGIMPAEAKNPKSPQGIHVFDRGGKPCLRIIKIASKSEAQPGEVIDFTLRFDNIGDQTIGNVTVIDNLVSRLEFIEGSDFCSIPAKFVPTANDDDSLTLRWEIQDPLKTMQGGIIRFKCRVR